jgi:hypothetical protein
MEPPTPAGVVAAMEVSWLEPTAHMRGIVRTARGPTDTAATCGRAGRTR